MGKRRSKGKTIKQEIDVLKTDISELKEEVGRSKSKDSWDKFSIITKALMPVVSAFLVILIAYLIKDSVDQALKTQQLEISSAKGMQELITELHDEYVTEDKATSAALALSAYGNQATALLVNELNGTTNARMGAEKGLFLIGLRHKKAYCEVLKLALNNHNKQFTWRAHKSVINLMGSIGCTDAIKILEDYLDLVKDDSPKTREAYSKIIRGIYTISVEHIGEVKEEIETALDKLKRQ